MTPSWSGGQKAVGDLNHNELLPQSEALLPGSPPIPPSASMRTPDGCGERCTGQLVGGGVFCDIMNIHIPASRKRWGRSS